MAWIFTVGSPTSSRRGDPQATYGWSHLHSFHRMLAAEEGLDLDSMQDFGGSRSWHNVDSPLRLMFDLDYINSEHPTSEYPALADRLRIIRSRWSTYGPADDEASPSMTIDQLEALSKLLSVVELCLSRGERLRVC
ncbi:hypothetical protein AB0F81_39755 [Actinoplanes sp. NPDC024001]|uniref:hypothetical protein n=1 Tax=Actinoplanes sp. NPDC024001 TaxID=3154598 RepID=UPI0033C3EDAD